jgi:hypothetical protein
MALPRRQVNDFMPGFFNYPYPHDCGCNNRECFPVMCFGYATKKPEKHKKICVPPSNVLDLMGVHKFLSFFEGHFENSRNAQKKA